MASGTFEKTSLSWQAQQLQQRIGEWLERIFSGSHPNLPNPSNWQIPDWLQKSLFWLIVLGLMLWAGWQLYKLLQPYFAHYWQFSNLSPPLASTRSSELTASDWLKRSRQAQQQGNYREACRALYLATLLHLNDKNLIHQEPSRTDGEYLNLIRPLSGARPYQTLIRMHERLCFSEADVSAEMFDRCWQAYQEIEGRGTKEEG